MPPNIIFIHCQSFSRKPNRAGQCVVQVIGEGLRSGEYHPHVETPKPPIPVFGDLTTFQLMHDAHVSERKTCAVKNGVVSERVIRQDRHTLFTIVASYPTPTTAVEGSSEELARFKRWVDLTVAWVREQYGDQLKVALAHIDEAHPHLHFWLLSDDLSADATLLHVGKIAKRETEVRLKSEGAPPREAVKAGNRALKSAMREWIDDYHRVVGAPLGMRRDGPKRRRLSRGQYQAEQAMLDHHRQLEADRIRLEAQVTKLEKRAITLAAQQRALEAKAAAFLNRAEQHHYRMQTEAAQVAALGPMLDALVTELEDRTITFHPQTGWRVRDPSPYRAAGKVWVKLEPAVRRLVGMVRAAEDGNWTAGSNDPVYDLPPRPDPTPFEAASPM
jgi:hypothetical protein